MVFSKDKTGAYRAEILYQRDDITGTGVLYKVPPGKYTDIEGAESIRLITDGFIYKTYEKGAILFYWKKDRFLELDIDN